MSAAPNSVTNNGHDDAFGYGVRIGYMGKITPTVTIGAAYASKMSFDEFDDYAGLFAEQGGFDIPENYNLGVAWQATPVFKLALDYQRISYSDVNSIANPSLVMAQLGADNGPGFGWQDIDVWKLGAEYKYSQQLTVRAGWSHGDNPISASDVTFNILAPGVIEDHVTVGFTYTLASGNELTMSYMHGFSNDVSGASILPVMFSGGMAPASGNETIEMDQNALGIQYSWKM
jgi:long-chain fatty acid transport protein